MDPTAPRDQEVHLPAVSLFSNCGAGDLGYRDAGFSFKVMAELDPRRLEVAALNHPGAMAIPGDLRQTWPEVVLAYRTASGGERPALLAACPPCQGMSSARGKRGLGHDADAGSADTRNLLVVVIANVARELMPRLIVVENVPQFFTRKVRHPQTKTPITAAALLIELLSSEYIAFPTQVELADYGVPQYRKRAFITLVHREEPALGWLRANDATPFPKPTHGPGGQVAHRTVRTILESSGLPPLDSTRRESAQPLGADNLHGVSVLPPRLYAMVAAIPKNTGRSAWENDLCGCGQLVSDRNAASCSSCGAVLPRPVVISAEGPRLIKGFKTSSYRRIRPDKPAATITTGSGHIGSHSTLHPWENRVLSTQECAMLQTFPDSFVWGESLRKWGHSNVRTMIGEAVPPLFTTKHGEILVDLLRGRTVDAMQISSPQFMRAQGKMRQRVGDANAPLNETAVDKSSHQPSGESHPDA